MCDFTGDLTLDDGCTNAPEMSDEEKNAFFASLDPQSEPTDDEMNAMAAEHEAHEAVDFDGYADGHRDSFYW